MRFNFDLNLAESGKLVLTPQVKQAIEILKLNTQELCQYIEKQLEQNPVLEIIDNECVYDNMHLTCNNDINEWNSEYRAIDNCQYNDFKPPHKLSHMSGSSLSLKEYLLIQLHTSGLDDNSRLIGEYLIDNIDENGYLTIALSEVARFFNININVAAKVLEQIQAFEPAGIGARDLKESLLIQLRHMENYDRDVIIVVEKFLEEVAANKIPAVARRTGLSSKRVTEIFKLIKSLEPKPGRGFFSNAELKYTIPDVYVTKNKGSFEVIINEDVVPLIGINNYYRLLAPENLNTETRRFLENKINEAAWLINCLEQRKNTMRRITESIIKRQKEFFEKGHDFIKPLSIKTVANEIDEHESTVKSIIISKYIQCAWGIFEIKYFFQRKKYKRVKPNILNSSIKAIIKELIEGEDKRQPLTDNKIAEILAIEGIRASRNTIGKYRNEIGVPNVFRRKNL